MNPGNLVPWHILWLQVSAGTLNLKILKKPLNLEILLSMMDTFINSVHDNFENLFNICQAHFHTI